VGERVGFGVHKVNDVVDVMRVDENGVRVDFFDGVNNAWRDAAGDREAFVRELCFDLADFVKRSFVSFDGADVDDDRVGFFFVFNDAGVFGEVSFDDFSFRNIGRASKAFDVHFLHEFFLQRTVFKSFA